MCGFNRYLKHGIQTFAASHKLRYDGLLDLLTHYRATAMTPVTGTSPAEIFFGRTARLNFQVVRPKPNEGGKEKQQLGVSSLGPPNQMIEVEPQQTTIAMSKP